MRRPYSVLLFILVLSSFAFSQAADENAHCPTLDVTGPAGIVSPGQSAIYTANIDTKGKELQMQYIWTISAGEISSGQNTNSITVKQPEFATITATVEIKGFPEGCPNIDSEASIGDPNPQAVKIDEFSLSEQRIDKARLDYFLTELSNNPNDQGYIIEKFKRGTSQATMKSKFQKIRNYIKLRRFDATRIILVHDFGDENSTNFWRVPPGADGLPMFK